MEPKLTPSERGYLFNRDGFLAGIKERGARLFEDGYRAHATAEPYVFVVTVPCKDGEKSYFLNVVNTDVKMRKSPVEFCSKGRPKNAHHAVPSRPWPPPFALRRNCRYSFFPGSGAASGPLSRPARLRSLSR